MYIVHIYHTWFYFSALTLFENNMMVCDVLLSSPEKTLRFFDLALLEAQSVVMESHPEKEDMVTSQKYLK